MEKLSKLKNSRLSLSNIDFNSFSNSKFWVGYFKSVDSSDFSLIEKSTSLVIDFFKDYINDFFLLSALTENPDYEHSENPSDFDVFYDKLFRDLKYLNIIQEYNDDFRCYFENDEKLNAKLINIDFDINTSIKTYELLMFYYFNRVWGQVCFLINPKLEIALYPHDDTGYGCIGLNEKMF